MPNTREKLIELLKESKLCSKRFDDQYSDGTIAIIADNLIAHGVTVQKWIPVTERLPTEEDAIEGGFVLANTEEKVIIAIWSDVCRFNEFVTHWMPLPHPPKEVSHTF